MALNIGMKNTADEGPKQYSAEENIVREKNHWYLWFYQNARYFKKHGEEMIGFGPGNVQTLSESLREARQKSQAYYLALLEFIRQARASEEAEKEQTKYSFQDVLAGLEHLGKIRELQGLLAKKKSLIDLTVAAGPDKAMELLVDVLQYQEALGAEEAISAVAESIAGCFDIVSGEIKEEMSGLLKNFFIRYFQSLDFGGEGLVGCLDKLREKHHAADFNLATMQEFISLGKYGHSLLHRRFDGVGPEAAIKLLLIDARKFRAGAWEKFFNEFFAATAGFLKPLGLPRQGWMDKEEVTESILAELKSAPDKKARVEAMKQVCEKAGSDIIFSHIYEFGLADDEIKAVVRHAAVHDPEAVWANMRHIDFDEFGEDKVKIFADLAAADAGLFMANAADARIARKEAIDVVLGVARREPMAVLVGYDQFFKKFSASPDDADKISAAIEAGFSEQIFPDVDILNNLTGVEISSRPELNLLVSNLRERAISGLAEVFLAQVKVKERLAHYQRRELDEEVEHFLGKYGLGLEKGKNDVYQYACVLSGEENFWELRRHTQVLTDKKVEEKEDKKEELLTNDAARLIIKKIFQEHKNETALLCDLIELYPLKTGRQDDQEMISQVTQHFIEKWPGPSGYFVARKNGLISREEFESRLEADIQKDARCLVELLWQTDFEPEKMLSDKQKQKIVEAVSIYSVDEATQVFRKLRMKNKFAERGFVQQMMAAGREPFCLFETANEAISILSMPAAVYACCAEVPIEEKQRRIAFLVETRKRLGGGAFDFLGSERNHNNEIIFCFSVEQLSLIERLRAKYPQVFKFLSGGLNESEKNWGFLLALRSVRNETDFKKLQKLAEEADECEKAGREKEKKDYARRFSIGRRKKGWLSGRQKGTAANIPVVERLHGTERNLCLDIAFRTGDSFRSVVERAMRVSRLFEEESQDFAYHLDFLLRDAEDAAAAFVALEENFDDLARLKVFLAAESHEMEQVLSDILKRLEKNDRKIFLRELDWRKLCSGFFPKTVMLMLLRYVAERVINLKDKNQIDIFRDFLQKFGSVDSAYIFKNFLALRQGKQAEPAFVALGVAEAGRAGERQLVEKCAALRDQLILHSELPAEIDFGNDAGMEILKCYSDFDTSGWRRSGLDLRKFLAEFQQEKAAGRVKPLEPVFTAKRISARELIDFSAEKIEISKSALEQYQQLRRGACLSKAARGGLASVEYYRETLLANISEEAAALESKKENLDKSQKISAETKKKILEEVESQIAALAELGRQAGQEEWLRGLLRLMLNYETRFGQNRECAVTSDIVRAIVYELTAAENEITEMAVRKMQDNDSPDKNDLESVIELINNVIKQHVVPRLTLNEPERKKLQKLFNMAALKQEVDRLNRMTSGAEREFLCVPSRDALAELSGYYCDACWTANQMIMRDNPEMTAVAFVSNPDNAAFRRLAGATLLIETTVGGRKAMVIRGFNPKQNIITGLNPGSFFENFVDSYLMPICRAKGVELILAPIDNSAGLTNRPTIEQYLVEKYSADEAEKAVLDKKIDFNGYDITNSCRVVREVR